MEKWIFERGILTHDQHLKKPFVSSFDTVGFSSLLLSQIPSLKFSAFSFGLGIELILERGAYHDTFYNPHSEKFFDGDRPHIRRLFAVQRLGYGFWPGVRV
jgi:hypothetical protein